MSRRFRGDSMRFELALGVAHHKVIVHTRDAREIRRFAFQAPSSSDTFPNANRANETGVDGPFALYRLIGTLATPDSPAPANWTTIDFIYISTTNDARNLVLSTSDVLLNSGPYRQLAFEMTYYPATSLDVPTLLVLEEAETRD